ncbi:MAG TPA: hypothetical protein VIV60_19135 [Polyangiaceae bacterium]
MQFAIVEEGETLPKLARRIYGACSEPEVARAVKELRAANHGLEINERLAAGSAVFVPAVQGLKTGDSVQSGKSTAVALVQSLRKQLGEVGAALEPALRQAEAQAEDTAKLVQSDELRDWQRKEPAIRERLGIVAESAKLQLERAKKLRELSREASVELDADLDSLLRLLAPAAGQSSIKESGRKG